MYLRAKELLVSTNSTSSVGETDEQSPCSIATVKSFVVGGEFKEDHYVGMKVQDLHLVVS